MPTSAVREIYCTLATIQDEAACRSLHNCAVKYKGGLLSHELSGFQAELEPPIYIIK